MPAENIKLNAGDNKSEVAYKMAMELWRAQDAQGLKPSPNLDNKKEFLDLVQECVRALKDGRRVIEN